MYMHIKPGSDEYSISSKEIPVSFTMILDPFVSLSKRRMKLASKSEMQQKKCFKKVCSVNVGLIQFKLQCLNVPYFP